MAAQEAVGQYYTLFQKDRTTLGALYEEGSTLSFEGHTIKGKAAIGGAVAKIPIPAGAVHRYSSTDLQPSPAPGASLALITGELSDARFSQVFQLVPKDGGMYIHNDIFRAGTSNADNAPEDIGGSLVKAFVTHYYNVFDSKREELASLYTAESMFSFEGSLDKGVEAILKKISSLPSTKHVLETIDLQSASGDKAVLLAFVTGQVSIDNDNPLRFCQVFQLVNTGAESAYYVHNDMFRLNYG